MWTCEGKLVFFFKLNKCLKQIKLPIFSFCYCFVLRACNLITIRHLLTISFYHTPSAKMVYRPTMCLNKHTFALFYGQNVYVFVILQETTIETGGWGKQTHFRVQTLRLVPILDPYEYILTLSSMGDFTDQTQKSSERFRNYKYKKSSICCL